MDAFKIIHAKFPKLPVIILSSQENVQQAADLMEAGAYDYIQKKDKNVVEKLKNAMLEVSREMQHGFFQDFWKDKVKHKSIFIVEDNPTYAKALELFLKQTFPDAEEVKVFPVGEVAVMELERGNPGVIIMDYNLDDNYYDAKSGLDAIKDIKAKKPDTNIILLSSQVRIDVAIEATKNYHCHYVQKDDKAFNKVEAFIKGVWV